MNDAVSSNDEVSMLRQRVRELEQAVSRHEQIAAELQSCEALRRRAENRFWGLIDAAPDAIIITQQDGTMILANHQAESLFGYDQLELLNQPIDMLLPERFRGTHFQRHLGYLSEPQSRPTGFGLDLAGRRKDGREIPIEMSLSPLEADEGTQVICSIRDTSARKRAEEERLRLQEEVIRMQEATLRELSTPLIPISDKVLVMPLVGAVDSQRAQQIVETLLQGVSERRAETALIDITGVSVVDTQVANILVQAAQAVELLGARVVLTGIRPEVAQILVGLGVSLGTMETRADLQSGIAYAFAQSSGSARGQFLGRQRAVL
jgi:rsbT co-antagonist protein RsbR